MNETITVLAVGAEESTTVELSELPRDAIALSLWNESTTLQLVLSSRAQLDEFARAMVEGPTELDDEDDDETRTLECTTRSGAIVQCVREPSRLRFIFCVDPEPEPALSHMLVVHLYRKTLQRFSLAFAECLRQLE